MELLFASNHHIFIQERCCNGAHCTRGGGERRNALDLDSVVRNFVANWDIAGDLGEELIGQVQNGSREALLEHHEHDEDGCVAE